MGWLHCRQVYPATGDKLKAFGVAVDKLGSLWDEDRPSLIRFIRSKYLPYNQSQFFLKRSDLSINPHSHVLKFSILRCLR